MRLIWQKQGVDVDDRIMTFLAGEDVVLDRGLFLYDVRASAAHVEGLERAGVLDADERDAILGALESLTADWEAGAFTLDERFEDGHSAIEAYLIERLGAPGKKVHTGRSRNDQVLVATRLYLKDALAGAKAASARIARAALDVAGSPDGALAMPGYTHLQRAVPSSVGMWCAAWAEAFTDDAVLLGAVGEWVDANPLGTAAGYGVNVPLDRAYTTQALGFGRMQVNPIYAQNSRGKFEMAALGAIGQAMLDVRRMAWDLSLFTTAEFDFVKLPPRYITGSSIMPNKKNPDVVELLRAAYAPVAGARAELEQVLSLPSGYHRDLQGTKGPLMRAVNHALGALELVADLIGAIEWQADVMRGAISHEMYATDLAVELTASGVPFREAYQQVADGLDQLTGRDPEASLNARVSPGACADLMLDELGRRLDALTHDQED